jgi:hypothetical protein
MHCSKGCGWNCTHTSGFHSVFTSNPSSFPAALPATHPYHQKIAKEHHQGLPPSLPNVLPINHTSTGPSSNGLISLHKGKLLAICEHHERAVADPTGASFLSDLKKLFNYDGGPGLVITHLSYIIQDFLIILSLVSL